MNNNLQKHIKISAPWEGEELLRIQRFFSKKGKKLTSHQNFKSNISFVQYSVHRDSIFSDGDDLETQIPSYKTGSVTEPSLLSHKRKGEQMTTGPVWKIKYLKTLKESTRNTGEYFVSLEKQTFLNRKQKLC